MMIDFNFFEFDKTPTNAMVGYYNLKLVFLSYVVAVFASYFALDLAAEIRERVTKTGYSRLFAGAFAMGGGIFTMHFIGMQSFVLPMHMDYNFYLTLLSLVVAIVASGFSLLLIKSKSLGAIRLGLGGVIMGLGIASMHYIGMASMVGVTILYIPTLFCLSIVIAITASIIALWLMIQSVKVAASIHNGIKVLSALIMGAGICGMHYMGMAAAIFLPIEGQHMMPSILIILSHEKLSFLIAFIAVSIIIVTLISSNYRHKILYKLIISYTVIFLLMILSAFIVIGSVEALSKSFDSVLKTSLPKMQALLEMRNIANQFKITSPYFISSKNMEDLKSDRESVLNEIREIDMWESIYSKFEKSDFEKHELNLEKLNMLKENVRNSVLKLIQFEELGVSSSQKEAQRLSLDRSQKLLADFITNATRDEIEDLQSLQEKNHALANKFYNLSLWAMFGIFIASIIVSLVLFFQICTPILNLRNICEKFAKGDFSVKIPINSKDEIGELAKSFDIMIQALNESNKKKNEFLGMAAHDLRNPLSLINEASSIVSSGMMGELKEKPKKMIAMINQTSTSMLSLIDELLYVNAMQLKDLQIVWKEVNISKFITEIFEFNKLIAHKKKIIFNLETHFEVETFFLDESKILQVINNFLSNAFKFSPYAKTVKLIAIAKKDLFRVEVHDEAGGIPFMEQPKIFTWFSKLSVKPTGGELSHGLGLAICKDIIEAHHGVIGFNSIPLEGSIFYFELYVEPTEASKVSFEETDL